jgi:DNA-binding XRE family transcriptional regulator
MTEVMPMTVSLKKMLAGLPRRRRAKIAARAQQILAEEKTLRELRHAREMTQQSLAKRLKIKQDGVSRIEQRSDLLLSTLRQYVAAMGGKLELIARFPDRAPIALTGLAELRSRAGGKDKPKRGRRAA